MNAKVKPTGLIQAVILAILLPTAFVIFNLPAQVTTGPARSGSSASATIFTNTPTTGMHAEATGAGGIGKWVWLTNSIGITIDGGGSAISTGVKGYIEVPYNCTVIRTTLLADISGSCVLDVWKDTFANYPPVVGDSMVGAGVKPTITTSTSGQDLNLADWTTTTLTAGDVVAFNVDSASTLTRVTLTLLVIH